MKTYELTPGHKITKQDVDNGVVCQDCGTYFKQPAGYRVVCRICFKRREYKHLSKVPISPYPEIDVSDLSPAEYLSILASEKYKQRKEQGI